MKSSLFVLLSIVAACVLAALVAAFWFVRAEKPGLDPVAPEALDLEGLREKAGRGDAEAQRTLGLAHVKGQGVKQDYAEAARWYRRAADQGNPKAQAALGELYEAGQGVPCDEAEAAQWYRRAAEQGDVFGQYSLAVLCVTGKGVPKDVAEAVKWYRQAAEQGNALAQYNLGLRHAEGDGVPRDPVEAYQWLSLAARQGIEDAAKARADLKSKMTGGQLEEGRRRAETFTAKPNH